jgi:hypothetical protein
MTAKYSTNGRVGDWIQTYSGRQFWPLDPRPEEVFIDDIAAHLSQLCRYNGACKPFLSVAQHSVYVSLVVEKMAGRGNALWGLLHDGSEAYCNDLTRPVKKHLYEYLVIEGHIQAAICERFALPLAEPLCVKVADNMVLLAEKRQRMHQPPKKWEEVGVSEADIKIRWWPMWYARWRFLKRFYDLGGVEYPWGEVEKL